MDLLQLILLFMKIDKGDSVTLYSKGSNEVFTVLDIKRDELSVMSQKTWEIVEVRLHDVASICPLGERSFTQFQPI